MDRNRPNPMPNPNRRLADTQPITSSLRPLALPAVTAEWMAALREAMVARWR